MRNTALVPMIVLSLVAGLQGAGAANAPGSAPAAAASLSAAQIVERNVSARGGLAAWHAVQTMTWKGKIGAGATTYEVASRGKLQTKQRDETFLPFTLEFKRPQKSRLEIQFQGQTAVQVFDGAQGWKLRPYLGRSTWDGYTPDELKEAAAEPGIDGFLIDYAAKGARVELVGSEKIEDQNTYKLKVTLKNGQVRHVWVDSRSFLEVKLEGLPRRLDGKSHTVDVYLREFKPEGGVMIPHVIEMRTAGLRRTEKIVIESATVNPKLDDARFTKSA